MAEFCCYYTVRTGVLFVASMYLVIDILKLLFHLMLFYFPIRSVLNWYIPQMKLSQPNARGNSTIIFDTYKDDVHNLIARKLFANPIQAIILLCLDIVTDGCIILSLNSLNFGLIASGIWLIKSTFESIVYIIAIMALAFAYNRWGLVILFAMIFVLKAYFMTAVARHFGRLRDIKDHQYAQVLFHHRSVAAQILWNTSGLSMVPFLQLTFVEHTQLQDYDK